MIEIPPYLKLIVSQGTRRASQPSRATSASDDVSRHKTQTGDPAIGPGTQESAIILNLAETRRRGTDYYDELPPNAEEAAFTLSQLQRQLPDLGSGVHDLHDNLDRSRVLDLLAPLVND